ncbi:BON domain-containing protein [Paraburkholderia pallida]|uniref:BON domain-containing protein n=1 Tax=Paraburkholderia pallida TaxID=2547399 RepID=A0A4P7CXY4_9BURK|nr:BON domain-containing protein [Paraburkholderia pallida]QBR01141.1 BON domain-containing protein [Paraburkholderia pallida]
MKTQHIRYLVAGLLIALTTLGARAQGANAAASAADETRDTAPGAAANSAAASNAKAIKAADRALQKAVVRALSKTRGLRVSTIGVRAHNGVVTLEGMVPDQSQVELAAKVAEGVPGVTQVKNALTLSAI